MVTTGAPQGQPGSAEFYASINKVFTIDECLDIEQDCLVSRQHYVDDKFDLIISSIRNHNKIIMRNRERLKELCLKSGECLNEEKTKVLSIGCVPQVEEKMLGMMVNTSLNSHSEIGPTLERVNKVINTTQACSFFTKSQRMKIARLQIFASLFNFIFIVVYASEDKLRNFRKRINIAFKKASGLPMITPTSDVENYIYGMSFDNYVHMRIIRFCEKQKKVGNDIFDALEYRGNAGTDRNILLRNKIGQPIGTLLKKYCHYKNNYSTEYYNNLLNNKKSTSKNAFRKCLTFKPHYVTQ